MAQKTLSGGEVPQKVKSSKVRYEKRAEGYEETFRDLMHYHVIEPSKIQSVEDFREITHVQGKRGRISEELVEALEHTMEYKELILEKMRFNKIKLKTTQATGIYSEGQEGYLYFDKVGSIRMRNLRTGRWMKTPQYYGLLPLDEVEL